MAGCFAHDLGRRSASRSHRGMMAPTHELSCAAECKRTNQNYMNECGCVQLTCLTSLRGQPSFHLPFDRFTCFARFLRWLVNVDERAFALSSLGVYTCSWSGTAGRHSFLVACSTTSLFSLLCVWSSFLADGDESW